MREVLVVIEDGIIKDVVSKDKETEVHVVTRGRVEIDKETSVVISKADSSQVTTIADERFDFGTYVKETYGIMLKSNRIH